MLRARMDPELADLRREKMWFLDVAGEPAFHAAPLRSVMLRLRPDAVPEEVTATVLGADLKSRRFDPTRCSIAVVLALLALPCAAAGEAVDAHVLEVNSTIRFKDARTEASQVKGTLLGLGGQALQVRPAGVADTLSVPLDMLRQLQVYRGSERRTSRGAWIGLLAGAATGAALSLLAVVSSQGEFIEIGPEVIPVGTALFGAGGALFGAAIGAKFTGERWESVPPPWAVLP